MLLDFNEYIINSFQVIKHYVLTKDKIVVNYDGFKDMNVL